MTWTYLSTAPGSSDRSWLRARIGDTSSDDPQLTDEELDLLLDNAASRNHAAEQAARTLAARYARKADRKIGSLSITWSRIAQNYIDLAERLRVEAAGSAGSVGVWAGGVSQADRDAETTDADRPARRFTDGQFADPGGVAALGSTTELGI